MFNTLIITKNFKRYLSPLPLFILFVPTVYAQDLLILGSNEDASIFPVNGWDTLVRDTTNTQFVNPDGNPLHAGIQFNAPLAYVGVVGSSPLNFQLGQRIVANFYNPTSANITFNCILSFVDNNNPNYNDPSTQWVTMYDSPSESHSIHIPAGGTAEALYYINDADRVRYYGANPTVGQHSIVNIAMRNGSTGAILHSIEMRNDADIYPPPAPQNFSYQFGSVNPEDNDYYLELSWDKCVDSGPIADGVGKYFIYRNSILHDCIPPEETAYLGDRLKYIDVNVEPGKTYTYEVTALDFAQFGIYPTVGNFNKRRGNEGPKSATISVTIPSFDSETLINPYTDLEYLGVVRLPTNSGSDAWDYAKLSMTYYPGGNPGFNPETELPGSIFAYGKRGQVAEISIPKPLKVMASQIGLANRSTTLQNFTAADPETAVKGLAYHPARNGVGDRLYYTFSGSYAPSITAPGIGSFDMNLSNLSSSWHLNGLPPNNIHAGLYSRFGFKIPDTWANLYTGGRSLGVGSTYISGEGFPSRGPTLFAVAPWENGSLPGQDEVLSTITLLRYGSGNNVGNQLHNVTMDYYGYGAAWLEMKNKQAVIISSQYRVGDYWYGDSNGQMGCLHDIPQPNFGGIKGGICSDKSDCLLFYNPRDLAKVAQGLIPPSKPQPYFFLDLRSYSLKSSVMRAPLSLAYDSERGYLYMMEHNGDPGYQYGYAIIHVWKIGDSIIHANAVLNEIKKHKSGQNSNVPETLENYF